MKTLRPLAFGRLLFVLVLGVGSLTAAYGQKEYSIAEIQGESTGSPHANETVRTKGIVTALTKRGFYMQTPDADADKNPKTSEGIYVFGSENVDKVAVGDLVQVDGTVTEYVPKNESAYFPITEISKPTIRVLSRHNPLPVPIVLTPADLDPKGKLDQMERFEGMRVKADIVVVGPTGGYPPNSKTGLSTSNGTFFATLQGMTRPFREAGVGIVTKVTDKLPKEVPAFDNNPEILRVKSDEQLEAKLLDLPAGATIKGLTGVIDYYKRFYSLLPDPSDQAPAENVKGFIPVSAAGERETTVGSFNIENFFDDEENSPDVKKEEMLPKGVFKNRLTKVSLAIRNVLAMPDVLGIVEVENLKVLKKVADRVNADAVAAGQPDPKYVAYLIDGNDVRGIDVGFLVKSAKIKVLETTQLAKDVKLDYPGSGDQKLFDRPPLLLKAEVIDAKSTKPLAFTVIVNHFKSYRGIADDEDGDRVRNKRRLEAEWLASFVQERAKAEPAERLMLCGDFNAFQFNDGYNDLIGILKGKPDPNVLVPSKTTYNTGLADLVEYVDQKNRYSYTYDGSAQVLDHIMVNKTIRDRLLKFGYARVDADFPIVWANDPTRPERISDHDAPIVFLNLDEPAPKPATNP
jgi:predicted extracellular nuclease